MFIPTEGNLSTNDMESIVNICTKSLETADQVTRHALAQLVGHVLASTQNERIPVASDASQKGKKDQVYVSAQSAEAPPKKKSKKSGGK